MENLRKLSLNPALKDLAASHLAAKKEEFADKPWFEFQAGSIPRLLRIDGVYDEYGSFRAHEPSKMSVRETRTTQVYWCHFTDSIHPEFGKLRPVIIFSRTVELSMNSIVVPITTTEKDVSDTLAVKLSKNPNPNSRSDCWAVADHLQTVSHWRLKRMLDKKSGKLTIPTVSQADFDRIVDAAYQVLPRQKRVDADKGGT